MIATSENTTSSSYKALILNTNVAFSASVSYLFKLVTISNSPYILSFTKPKSISIFS
ncbi:MAG: hypothetical protein HFJ45_09375 [Clostridia bacterium]|nr:hypothetical protein [Clostridia bacterium]